MRITEGMKYAQAISNVDQTSVRLDRANKVATSGERVNNPSDDPTAWAQMAEFQSRGAIMKARSSGARAASSDLDIAESSLTTASDLMVQAKSVALAMSNGTVDAQSRASAATQVDTIRTQLLSLANSKGATGYLFGGDQSLAPPFDANAKFVGDDGVRSVEIGEGKAARSNTSGAKAFTAAGGQDIFASLTQLSSDLRSNNVAGITTAIDTMTTANQQLINARVDAGSTSGTLKSSADVMDGIVTSLSTARSNTGDADMTAAYSELVAAQESYQGALAVTQRLLASRSLATGG